MFEARSFSSRFLLTGAVGSFILSVLLAGCSSVFIVRSPLGLNQIVCWGDSMTAGNEGVTDQGVYPSILQAEIGPAVINEGVGGQTSTQIGVRQGGVASYVTVVGGIIPAYGQGGVNVIIPRGYEPLTSPNGRVRGSILGVKGEITLSGFLPGGTFTFTPLAGAESPVPAPGTPRFIPETPYSSYLPIFWEGRNNLVSAPAGPSGEAQILADIAAQVAAVPKGQTFLVLPVLNENGPAERRAGKDYPAVIALNNALSTTYGSHYVDIRSLLVASYDPSLPTDVSDFENDMPPSSLEAITAEGTLAESIGSSDTSFTVNVASGKLRIFQNLIIDKESIHILAVDGSRVTFAIRGYGGIQSSHTAGAAVAGMDGTHLNKQGYAIVAKAVADRLVSLSAVAPANVPR